MITYDVKVSKEMEIVALTWYLGRISLLSDLTRHKLLQEYLSQFPDRIKKQFIANRRKNETLNSKF